MENSQHKFNYILLPFSFIYGTVVRARNLLFDWNIIHSRPYHVPIICVGNLAVGGTGKTPLVEYLIRLLSQKYRVGVLSRGYKRKKTGFILANEKSSSFEIGDEACQIKVKYPNTIVAVDKKRRRGIQELMKLPEDLRPQVILLDDAFQHRYVLPSLSILVTDYNRMFYQDRLLPVGRLREPISSSSRSDLVVVSKCDSSLKPIECRIVENNMDLRKQQPLFFTTINYQKLNGVFPKECYPRSLSNIKKDESVLLLTGIANPTLIIEEVKKYTDNLNVLSFPDHHAFKKRDVKKIEKELKMMNSENPLIICTEKDAARIRNNSNFPEAWRPFLFYLPIEIQFMFEKRSDFNEMILNHVATVENSRILRD